MAERKPLDMGFERQMSDAEALMWNIEKDPWLDPSGAMITLLDRPVDWEQFRRRMRVAAAEISRLHERVVSPLGRLRSPVWEPDTEFDFDHHVRRVALPAPGGTAELFDYARKFYDDPYDRTRPLWMFHVIEGLAGGRGAIVWKTHHSITDGIGGIRLSNLYMERTGDEPWPDEVDLDAVVAASVAARAAEKGADDDNDDTSPKRDLTSGLRQLFETNRKVVAEAALVAADPARLQEMADGAWKGVRGLRDQVGGREIPGGSPLWTNRSRRRHIERLRVPLEDAKAAGKALGGSVNDFFMVGAVIGILDHHRRFDVPVEALNTSFVVSTRTDKTSGGNAFTPSLLQASGRELTPAERFVELRDIMLDRRKSVGGGGGPSLSEVARVANLLPTSVVTRIARQQAAKQDFATSNLRAAPFAMYISGALVIQNVTMGPVAATAMNLTTLGYNNWLEMGAFMDPAAVTEPELLREDLLNGYRQLAEAGGVDVDWGPDEFDRLDEAALASYTAGTE